MKNIDRIGEVVIRPGNEYQEPAVVYVVGLNRDGMLICRVINKTTLMLSDPEEHDLVDFEWPRFQAMSAERQIFDAQHSLQDAVDEAREIEHTYGRKP